jgi:hypothetical protein
MFLRSSYLHTDGNFRLRSSDLSSLTELFHLPSNHYFICFVDTCMQTATSGCGPLACPPSQKLFHLPSIRWFHLLCGYLHTDGNFAAVFRPVHPLTDTLRKAFGQNNAGERCLMQPKPRALFRAVVCLTHETLLLYHSLFECVKWIYFCLQSCFICLGWWHVTSLPLFAVYVAPCVVDYSTFAQILFTCKHLSVF